MQARELRRRLEELHTELESMRDVDDETREHLRQLADDVRPWIEPRETSDAPPSALMERLRESIERFESHHPTLSAAVARISHALAQVGI